MKKPDRSSYTSLDFLQWRQAGTLVISPKFQRRGVWSRPAQSYLIDTLLLGLPVPPVYLRVIQDKSKKGIIREVVDGQQRITTVLSYMNDDFPLSKNIESPCIGKRFSELRDNDKESITQFSFVCEVFYGIEDAEILQIFARLNTHSVKLNNQELRNGKYFGSFKRCAYALGFAHLKFWQQSRIFSDQAIARMQEVELVSELLICMMAGLQDKKKSIDAFYSRYDTEFPDQKKYEDRFRAVIDAVNETAGTMIEGERPLIASTEFRRVPLFYSLFSAIYHRMFGLPNSKLPTLATGKFTRGDRDSLEAAIRKLSLLVSSAKEEQPETPDNYEAFVTACLRQTDNIRPRQVRAETIYKSAFD